MFVFQFCDVTTVANIHKRKEPNLAIVKTGEKTFLESLYVLANLQEMKLIYVNPP
jgi:hypothetical protein